ncbi:MAG: hypothetical protein ACRYFZ_03985 [Janthinobacterium lividum]
MYKRLLLALPLLSAALAAHAQQPKRLSDRAYIDSLLTAYKAINQGLLSRYKQEAKAEAATKRKLDKNNGFRDFHLGKALTSYPALKPVEDDKNITYYTKPGDAMQLGEAVLSELVYGFYKGKLYSIHLKTKGRTASRKAKEALVAQYGPGFPTSEYSENCMWLGKVVCLYYKEDSLTHDANIRFSSMPMMNEKYDHEHGAAQKAGRRR